MSKSAELDQAVKRYILECVELDESEQPILTTAEKIAYIKRRSESEKYNPNQTDMENMTDWLRGLALNIAYNGHEILALAVEWGSIPADATEKQEQKIIDNYFHFMANKTAQLIRGYHIPKD